MIDDKRNIIHQLLQEYDIQTAEDIQDALKDPLGGTIKKMMEAEMDEHLGYGRSEHSDSEEYYGRKYKTKEAAGGCIKIPGITPGRKNFLFF